VCVFSAFTVHILSNIFWALSTTYQMIADAMRNKALDANIPLLDTSFSKVLKVAKVITNKLFEFFVKVEDFEDRTKKVSSTTHPSSSSLCL
jgi:hypothetical protein